jgi:uncharacterized membrane protein YjjP (DUF1212 family)
MIHPMATRKRRTVAVERPVRAEVAEAFLLSLARALHRYGSPAHRLEAALTGLAERLGLMAEFFATPTAIFARFGEGSSAHTSLERLAPGGHDLDKLSKLDRLADSVAVGETGLDAAARQVRSIVDAPSRWSALWVFSAFAVASAGAARFFGGGPRDMAAAAVAGMLLGILERFITRAPTTARVFEAVAALAVSVAASVAASLAGCSASVVTLAGLIVLVPGLTLTLAMSELATRHLASGTARLTGAMMTFFLIGFGVSFGSAATRWLPAPSEVAVASLPGWTEVAAVVAVGLALVVLFQADPRDAAWIVTAGAAGYYGTRLGGAWLGPELGTFVGGAFVGMLGNGFARTMRRPSAVVTVPGIMLLVPGSVGYRSLMSLMQRDTLLGIETAVTAAVVASALVTGLLVANVMVPPRRNL